MPQQTLWKAEAIAMRVVKELGSPGIFAVELLINRQGEVFVNETAPRVHNSGHHTIEGNYSSQFDMLWRIILGYPMGNTAAILPRDSDGVTFSSSGVMEVFSIATGRENAVSRTMPDQKWLWRE